MPKILATLFPSLENKTEMNKERTIVTILREIAEENGFEYNTFSYDWVKTFSKGENSMYVYGYNFPINCTTFTQIANDKACTSEILSARGIPNVPHFYFMSPNDIHYVKYLGVEGNWRQMLALLEKYGKIICKPNSGTGGVGLKIVDDETGLEKAVNELFSKESTMCICPYYNIENEYRVIILDGKVQLIFKKVRPNVTGNGQDNVASLCAKDGKKVDSSMSVDMAYIPAVGETVEIGWKHNLGQGSFPKQITSGEIFDTVSELALKTLSILGGRFASVDCVLINGEYRVLEVNSGVMMDNFALASKDNYMMAKNIYKAAIDKFFQMQ